MKTSPAALAAKLAFWFGLGVACNGQSLQGIGGGVGGGFEKPKDSNNYIRYMGKQYHEPRIVKFGETKVTIKSSEGSVEIPVSILPFRLHAEHKAWLQAHGKEQQGSPAAGAPASAQVIDPAPPTTTQGWQAAAVKKYPELGVLNSAFNNGFVEEVAQRRKTRTQYFKDPRWPMTLADELAPTLESPEAKKTREINELQRAAVATGGRTTRRWVPAAARPRPPARPRPRPVPALPQLHLPAGW